MTIRTFRAPTVGEALAQVKKELGAGAVILHTRTYKVGGVLGVGARTITEITATTEMHVTPAPPRGRATPTPAAARTRADSAAPAAPAAATGTLRAEAPLSPATPAARAQAATAAVPARFMPAAAPQVSPHVSPPVSPAVLVPAPAARGGGVDELIRAGDPSLAREIRDEMAMLRRVVARMAVGAPHSKEPGAPAARGAGGAMPDALAACYLKMIESEVASDIADEVVSAVREALTPAQLADAEAVRRAALARLARFVPACASDDSASAPPPGADGRPHTVALVGPTGVGKTTTIAKLAATYKLRMGRRVGLITADTYRIAAVDQLRTYAGIIGLPLKVVLTPAEMRAACESLRDCDTILIDTAGRAPSDQGRLGELGAFLDAALPHETHLVLSSASSESCLRQAARAFAAVGPSHLIFTKLDEAVSFGALVNIVKQVNAKLSFLTTGQEVPDHIEAASAPRLAGLILEGGAVR